MWFTGITVPTAKSTWKVSEITFHTGLCISLPNWQHAVHINISMVVSVHAKHTGTVRECNLDEREFHLILKSPCSPVMHEQSRSECCNLHIIISPETSGYYNRRAWSFFYSNKVFVKHLNKWLVSVRYSWVLVNYYFWKNNFSRIEIIWTHVYVCLRWMLT